MTDLAVPIIAIDPGSAQSALVVALPLDKVKPVVTHIYAANEMVLSRLMGRWTGASPVVIEDFEPWSRIAGHAGVQTCQWIGIFRLAAKVTFGVWPTLLRRRDVCYHLTTNPQASKAEIRAFLIDRYGPGKDKAIGTKKTSVGPLHGLTVDEFDALALALVYAEKN